MDTEMGETGEGPEEVKHSNSELGGAKLNGDMNGIYDDEPMDVSDRSPDVDRQESRLKKVQVEVVGNSSDAVAADIQEENSCEPVEASKDVPTSSQVPKCEPKDSDSVDEEETGTAENGYDESVVDADGEAEGEVVEGDEEECEKRSGSEMDREGPPPQVSASDIGDNELGDKRQNSGDSDRDRGRVDRPAEADSGKEKPGKPDVVIISSETKLDNKELSEDESTHQDCDVTDSKANEESPRATPNKPKEDADESITIDKDNFNLDTSDDRSEPTVIDIDITPEKSKKSRKSMPINITPRRSSRNLNKQKSYIEKDERDVTYDENDDSARADDPDIEEIQPQDPLADIPMDKSLMKSSKKTTIVVNDTKRLAEIAAGSKNSKGGKKEPTLVIIDTNSILSGRGPVPLPNQHQTVLNTGASLLAGPPRSQNPGYSVLPISLQAQGMYATPANLRPSQASIKPMPIPQAQPVTPPPKPPVVLPSLTDDMYVVEAPSFIVPYVYEKPPIKPLKEFVDKLEEAVKEARARLEKERKEKEEQEKKEQSEQSEADKNKSESKETDEEEKGDAPTTSKEADDKMEVDEVSPEKVKVTDEKSDDDKGKEKAVAEAVVDDDKPKDLTKEKPDKEKEKDKEKESKAEGSESSTQDSDCVEVVGEKKKPGNSYFDNALGKFFMQIGINLVQEHVQTDLLRSQKRKRDREGKKCAPDVHMAINSLMRTLEFSKENNEPFKMDLKKCEFCSFKTESQLVMAHHLETPHMRNYVYRCNFCTLEVRSPHDILFHMEAEHNVRGRLERAPAYHQCPSCPFEDNQKGKLTRHLLSCAKKYRAERNQEPPLDWEPPAKIPRVPRNRPSSMSQGSALYQAAMSGLKQGAAQGVAHPLLPKLLPSPSAALGQGILNRGRGRPQLANRYIQEFRSPTAAIAAQQKAMAAAQMRPGMVYRPSGSNSQPQVLLPTSYQIAGNQIYQVVGNQGGQGQVPMVGGAPRLAFVPPGSAPSPTHTPSPTPVALVPNIAANSNSITIQSSGPSVSSSSGGGSGSSSGGGSGSKQGGSAAAKLLQQPSISITPLPRQQTSTPPASSSSSSSSSSSAAASSAMPALQGKPGRPLGSGKATFVICEICDGYIKDLELLRNHMQWIHKVKIHPKMIYNRPPLNCQKCQFRFFTDQGLERHLLGSHGLVTSSMQEAANKGKDGGRCPVCGRVYQWKLLNHVARDHNMSLKPAHLSYKCTVCTATFGMYKQFENHVYSAHSVVAKRVMDKKSPNPSQQPSTSSSSGDSLLKPLKINDEITIIPQPPRSAKTKSSSGGTSTRASTSSSGANGSGSGTNSSSGKSKV